jgi:hypothetical protein
MVLEASPHLGVHIEEIGWLYMYDEQKLIMDALQAFKPVLNAEVLEVNQLALEVYFNQSLQAVAFKVNRQQCETAGVQFHMFEHSIFELPTADAIAVIQDRNFNLPLKQNWFTRLDVGLNANPNNVNEIFPFEKIDDVLLMYKGFCNEQM